MSMQSDLYDTGSELPDEQSDEHEETLEDIVAVFSPNESAEYIKMRPDQRSLARALFQQLKMCILTPQEAALYPICINHAVRYPGVSRAMWLAGMMYANVARAGRNSESIVNIITAQRAQDNVLEQIEAKKVKEQG